MSNARLTHALTMLRASLWVIPGLMVLGAISLALAVAQAEAAIEIPPGLQELLFAGGPAGARAVLAAIAGSMIGVTGVIFSITIVALSFASTQLGPRLLRNFMRDRSNQLVLGVLLATFLFALMGLRNVGGPGADEGNAWLTVLVALALSLVSLALLIYFIHHMSHGLQAETVISNVSAELHASVDRLFPAGAAAAELPLEEIAAAEFEGGPRDVRSTADGYLQAVDLDELMGVASRRDLVLKLERRPGRFVVAGETLLRAWPADAVGPEVLAELESAFLLGSRRTAEQDAEFLVDQLVEIAVRSLSPGINDPFTAMACVDHLAAGLAKLSQRRLPDARLEDKEGITRIVTHRSTFQGFMDAAFHQIRQHAAPHVSVTIRLLEGLEVLAVANEGNPSRLAIVRDHAERVLRSSRLVRHEERDAADVERRHARILELTEVAAAPSA